jgi:hypothetical protein
MRSKILPIAVAVSLIGIATVIKIVRKSQIPMRGQPERREGLMAPMKDQPAHGERLMAFLVGNGELGGASIEETAHTIAFQAKDGSILPLPVLFKIWNPWVPGLLTNVFVVR